MMTETGISNAPVRALPMRRLAQVGRDFLIGAGAFIVILLATAPGPDKAARGAGPMFSTSAHAAGLASVRALPLAPTVYRSTDASEAKAILGLVFASLVAFNLGVLRHLRRVYASPR